VIISTKYVHLLNSITFDSFTWVVLLTEVIKHGGKCDTQYRQESIRNVVYSKFICFV